MQSLSLTHPVVNTENNFLFISSEFGPCVRTSDNSLECVPDCDFGAWFIRTHYRNMESSPEAAAWFAQHNPLNLPTIPHLLNTPKIYQNLALFRMSLGNCALWLDMGLGKSFITLSYCLSRLSKLFLIVCPLSVFVTWEDEIIKQISPSAHAQVIIAHGPKRKRLISALKTREIVSPTFIITTYESLESIREEIQSLPLGAIFFDEASRVKNWEAARTRSAHALVRSVDHVPRFLLSGTPSTASVGGYYSLYELLQRGSTGFSNIFAFKHHFINQKKFMIIERPDDEGNKRLVHVYADASNEWLQRNHPPNRHETYAELGYTFQENVRPEHNDLKIVRFYKTEHGAKNLPQLINITKTWAYTLKKQDVAEQLPPLTFTRRMVEMGTDQEKAYREILFHARTTINQIPFSYRNLQSPYAKLHQIANGYLIHNDKTVHFFDPQPKLNELKLIIDEAGMQDIVIFCPFIPQIKQISAFLTKEEIKHVTIYGATSREQRKNNVREFIHDPECRVFLGNPDVVGLGLNLTNACLEVFVSNWFKPDIRAQAIDRCHRQGQQQPVSVIDLVTRSTIEIKILDSLNKKIDLENQILTMQDLGE